MLTDRVENVEAIKQIADQLHSQTDASEREQIKAEVNQLLSRWSDLQVKVKERSKNLDDNLG